MDATFGPPRAVLAISAQATARAPLLLAAERYQTVHDFGGFPKALYTLRYDAPGAQVLAGEVQALLRSSCIEVQNSTKKAETTVFGLSSATVPQTLTFLRCR